MISIKIRIMVYSISFLSATENYLLLHFLSNCLNVCVFVWPVYVSVCLAVWLFTLCCILIKFKLDIWFKYGRETGLAVQVGQCLSFPFGGC